jgi:hypothetical protein
MAAKTAMMAITTSSSIRVKPDRNRDLFFVFDDFDVNIGGGG